MAKYLDRLNQLLSDGKISQEEHDELADLSVAKEAIKEFNQVASERDSLKAQVQTFESLPKRKAALEPFGINYDNSPKYLRQVFDQMDPEKLGDKEYVSKHLADNEVDVNLKAAEGQQGTPSGAAQIVNHAASAGAGVTTLTDRAARIEAAQSPEELDTIYKEMPFSPTG
jgi:hypothetical protein